MRYAAKVDANQPEIVKALRDVGCCVALTHAIGDGFPDLIACKPFYPYELKLLEVKDGAKPPSARKLTPDQEAFHAKWKGPIYVVKSVDEALDVMGIVRKP